MYSLPSDFLSLDILKPLLPSNGGHIDVATDSPDTDLVIQDLGSGPDH
jgi:hypothetical protein